jgi:chromosome segregation ATPase
MAAMKAGIHADMFALTAAHDLQMDSLRKEIGVTRASLLSTMTTFREAVDQRFEDSDTQLRGVRGDVAAVKEEVGFLRSDVGFLKEETGRLDEKVTGLGDKVTGLDEKVTLLDVKLDTLIAEIRGGKN